MINRLLKEVKEYRKASFLAPICMIGEVVCELSLPFLMSFIIDEGVYKGNLNSIIIYGIVMIICAFVSLFFGTASANYAAFASTGFVSNIRKAMFENIQKFSFRNIDKYSTSGLVTRLTSDATNIQNAYQMILRMCIRAPLTLIIALFMTFYINSELALIFVVAAIFLGLVLGYITTKAYPIFSTVFKKYDDLNSSVQENITNIRVVKAYVKEENEIIKFKKASSALYKMFIKAESILVYNSPVMQLTMYFCLIFLSWFGTLFIVNNKLETGQLMSMFTYTMSILMALMMLSMIFVMLSMSVASCSRIVEILNDEPEIKNPLNPIYNINDGSIQFSNVYFSYFNQDDKYVLQDINLKINSGETIGIIGATGSGKSTLVSLISRLFDVSKGEVIVANHNVKAYDIESLRTSIAFVLQKNVLFSGTINENLRWGNESASDEEIIMACKNAQADEFINSFPNKYNTHIEQGGTNVSGGQKQRLCIARALLKKPKILILDDSTSAVDTKCDQLIRHSFKHNLNVMTKIIIAQRISSIEDADRIIVLNNGIIDGFDSHSKLLKTNKIYQEIYKTQVKGSDING